MTDVSTTRAVFIFRTNLCVCQLQEYGKLQNAAKYFVSITVTSNDGSQDSQYNHDSSPSVVDTPCSSRQQKPTRRERRLADAEVDPGDMIENLPQKDFLSLLQKRFKEFKVGK